MSKIVHLCLCGPVTDGFNYQENLLTKYHKKLGYDVSIIASEWIWGEDGELRKEPQAYYDNENKIPVIRLCIKKNKSIEAKFKRYENLYVTIETEAPDILFVHGCQFLDLWTVRKYRKKHPQVRLFIDNHADFSNSGTNFLSKHILHKGIWRVGAKAIEPYVEQFYGVLPARVDFLIDMYKLPKDKVQLLVMGADDERVSLAKENGMGEKIRERFKIAAQDFLVVTGGKIDRAKRQTIHLMRAVKEFPDERVKLLVFGSVEKELKEEVGALADGEKVHYAGWIDAEESYAYFEAADLVCFPGRHSVFWEQAAGQGLPMAVKYWDGTTHIDVGGNVRFLYKDSADEIEKVLWEIADKEKEAYKQMRSIAQEKGKQMFSYGDIAKRAIEKRTV